MGEIGREMFFIRKGFVKIIVPIKGVKTCVANLGEGKFFGEMALLLNEKRSADVEAGTYCDLFVLSKEDLDKVRAEFPEESDQLTKVAHDRLKEMQKKKKGTQADDKKNPKKLEQPKLPTKAEDTSSSSIQSASGSKSSAKD